MTTSIGKEDFTTADAVVKELIDAGVEVVFGVVSIHNLPIYDAIAREGSIHLVKARGESGAVNMADAYARATGKLGVVITSTGTGAGNGAGALIEAWSAGSPVLHITGEVASPYLGLGKNFIHECKDQLSMMEASCKKAYLLRVPDQAIPMIRKSIQEALTAPSGPVTLEIPIDLQSRRVPKSMIKNLNVPDESLEIPIQAVSDIAEIICRASRPVIWAGGGVIKANASLEIQELAEKIGAPVITSQSGKGSIPEDHPLCIGSFSATEEVEHFLKKADLLISVGVTFRANETNIWKLVLPEQHIGINIDLKQFNLNYPVSYGLVGDAKTILRGINRSLKEEKILIDSGYMEEIQQLRQDVRLSLRKKIAPYDTFSDHLQKILPDDAILVRDVTVPATAWGGRLIDIHHPRTSIHAAGGGIGQGLPMAIGAQIGCRDQLVVLMVGDGGLMVNVGEMATAAEEKLPIVVILFDDAGYGILRNIQDERYKRRAGVDLFTPDFVSLGKSMGFEAVRVGSSEEFSAALKKAVLRKNPYLIVVDMQKIGPMNTPFLGPVRNP
jgi:acetolactate synthase-1/2/3 large subunit